MINKLATYMCIAAALACCGCATAHRKLTAQTAVLGQPFIACNAAGCATIQNWEVPGSKAGTTSQLTVAGCAVHTLVTAGHIARECRSVHATRGKWFWQTDRRTVPWTAADWELSAEYYGKPYLTAPAGWRWICYPPHYDRCYIDKNEVALHD